GVDFSVQTLSEHFDAGVALLADNQLHPALPQPAMTIIQGQIAQGVEARNRSPGFLTQRSLRQAISPKDDPSLRIPTGETGLSLTLDQVKQYYRYAFRPDLTTIVVIGKINPDQARVTIE